MIKVFYLHMTLSQMNTVMLLHPGRAERHHVTVSFVFER